MILKLRFDIEYIQRNIMFQRCLPVKYSLLRVTPYSILFGIHNFGLSICSHVFTPTIIVSLPMSNSILTLMASFLNFTNFPALFYFFVQFSYHSSFRVIFYMSSKLTAKPLCYFTLTIFSLGSSHHMPHMHLQPDVFLLYLQRVIVF